MSSGACIYTIPKLCNGSAPLHPKEHYLPAGLGEFKGDKRLANVICNDCQAKFGQLEDVFLHNSPEAFFRVLLGQRGRRRAKKKNIFYDPTAGIAPLPITGKPDDLSFPVLWEPVSIFESQPIKQIVFRDEKTGEYHHLPYRPSKLTSQVLASFIANSRISEPKIVGYLCDTDNKGEEEEIRATCGDLLKGRISDAQLPHGTHIEGHLKAPISLPYLRCLAKIAFHFTIAYFPFSGFEREFDGIKRFIFTGEDRAQFIYCLQDSLVGELRDQNVRARQWQHVLSAQYDYDRVEARMQFFIGPYVTPHTWAVKLGRSPARVVASYGRGFAYRYYDDLGRDGEGYVGNVIELARGGALMNNRSIDI